MELSFLGTGSAFTVGDGNWHSNMLVRSPNNRLLLIDCGSDARFSMAERGLDHDDLDAVYVSHLHSDHVGGLEWLGFSRFFGSTLPRPRLFIEAGLVGPLWDQSLAGGMARGTLATLDTYFAVEAIPADESFQWEGYRFDLTGMVHCRDGHTTLTSYGLRFAADRTRTFITTDTRFEPDDCMRWYEWADIIFHDCETRWNETGNPQRSDIHAHYEDLKTLPASIRRKIWLYHYHPGWLPDAVSDGFAGFARKGQSFLL